MIRSSFHLTRHKPTETGRLSRASIKPVILILIFPVILFIFGSECLAQPKRLVVVKCDGLRYDLVDQLVQRRDGRTGKSALPWIDYIFYQKGTRLANFYVRGMSLSGPSWSLLDTGEHLQIKGNVEFDRYTLYTYDYLNFIPFYISGVVGARIDMPAVELLDSLKIPMLSDAYGHDERYTTFSLFQRGPRFATLQSGLQNRFAKPPKELFDEWTMGFDLRSAFVEQFRREMIQKLANPKLRYLDLYTADFDHVAHHNNDLQSQLNVLKELDSMLGEIWTAIQKTSVANETALILVSDHGFNSDEKIYSQGYNLVKFLGSRAGGGHHVVTKRRLMLEYAIKGMYPLVPLITTTTPDTYYLKGQSTNYPTAVLDFDGNERASVHLRDSDLNLLQILLQQLQRNDLSPGVRKAATDAFFATIDRRRAGWLKSIDEINLELGALHRSIEKQQKLWEAQPKKFSKEEQDKGLDDAAKRVFVQLDRWQRQEQTYTDYVVTLQNLLALSPGAFNPSRILVDTVIKKVSMGEPNTLHQLQNYVVGLSPEGFVLQSDGSLDLERSFIHLNYFSLLHDVNVRNNIQRGVSNRPIDLVATRLASSLVAASLNEHDLSDDAIWIDAGNGKQALLVSKLSASGELSLRMQPITNLTETEDGRVTFTIVPWQPDLPLKIFEDPQLKIPGGDRAQWLSGWHTDLEWLHALHRTQYSNGLIGLHEELARHPIESTSPETPNLSEDDRLMRRFARRQRQIVEADFLIVANNHWNFDVRGFNPGGNHGAFFRISTHSTFMVSGGSKTQIPAATVIDEPYDSLSFVPTLLALTGNLRDDREPIPSLWERGFRRFSGRVVKELLPDHLETQRTTTTGVSPSP
jgi:type I phosphodiesterase/nucleotide pyrophosphatase